MSERKKNGQQLFGTEKKGTDERSHLRKIHVEYNKSHHHFVSLFVMGFQRSYA